MIKSSEDIFVINCWIDNKTKENDLINLINRLKEYGLPIVLTGHYPIKPEIQRMVDYYLFDKKNPLVFYSEYVEYKIDEVRWTEMPNCKVENRRQFNHDYAIWETMRNAFKFCQSLGYKYIHFMEYDNLPDRLQYRQTFLERIRDFNAVIYEHNEGSTLTPFNPFCAAFIFSIRTEIAVKTIDKIKTKEEFYKNSPGKLQLEKNFLNSLKKVTDSIHVTKYIPNVNELNIRSIWNRLGENFQFYTAVDNYDDLYLHIISKNGGTLEITYGEHRKFYDAHKDEFSVYKLGKYQINQSIIVYYQGIEIFNEFIQYPIEEYREFNKLIWKSEGKDAPKEININFLDGPFVEIRDDKDKLYKVEFIDLKTNKIEYSVDLKNNTWAKSSKKHHIDWYIRIKGIDNDYFFEHTYNVEGKKVLISFESKSLGDTLAWIPYVEKYRIEKKCNVVCSTFHNNLFKSQYPKIEFVEPGATVNNLYSLYRIGVFLKTGGYDDTRHMTDPKPEPLTKIASDILGLDFVEEKPKLPVFASAKKKMVSIGVHATAQCKYWNNPTGWQDVVDFLNKNGYTVKLLSNEEDGYMGNKNPKNVKQLPPGKIETVLKTIQESELFIGISSGLSWLSWAAGTETIIISGFTDVQTEPKIGVRRIINKNVCNSCWSEFTFDPGDWYWCPRHKNTDRMFECSKQISSEQVIEQIKLALNL